MTDDQVTVTPLPRVTLIGDGDEVRQLASMLSAKALRVELLPAGRHGYERIQAARPDLLLLQREAPSMDGFCLLHLVRSNPLTREVPVILLMQEDDPSTRLAAFREGVVDVISVPFLLDEVLARVKVHLGWLARVRQAVEESGRPSAEPVSRDTTLEVPVPDQQVLVHAVQRYIADNLSAPLSVSHLARRFAVSERRLSLAFKTCLGMSVFAYVRQERMRKAQYLLTHTALGMEAIAAEVGFSTAANFSTAFHAYCGMTPTSYRSAAYDRLWLRRGESQT